MNNFNLLNSIEFQNIKIIKSYVNNLLANAEGNVILNQEFLSKIVSLIFNFNEQTIINNIISNTNNENLSFSILKYDTQLFSKRKDLYSFLTTFDFLLNTVISQYHLKLSKNIYNIYALSNYAFLEYIFRYECETNNELKKFRNSDFDNNQFKVSRTIRRKAEEAYKSKNFDEAITNFNEALSKNDTDFTIYYQLGLIYLFEKADFEKAMENFRLACKYSQNKYNLIYINSMCLIGLMLRLYALETKNNDMLTEAYQATYQGYMLDTSYQFSKYALLQCIVPFKSKTEFFNMAISLIQNLISYDKFFALQILFDMAFSSFINEYEKVLNDIYSNINNSLNNLFEKINLSIEYLSNNLQYLIVPAKVSNIKNEYKKLYDYYKNKKLNLFELENTYNLCLNLSQELDSLSQEVEKNKKYYEIKTIVETAISNYNQELQELILPYNQTEEKFNNLKQSFLKLEYYYPNPEIDIKNLNFLTTDEQINLSDRKFWRDSGIFLLVKLLGGCLAFLIMFIIIIIMSAFISKEFVNTFRIVGTIINFLFIPLYSFIISEVFYNFIEVRRHKLISDLKKLKAEIDINKIKIHDIEKKLSEKYIFFIAENGKFNQFVSEKLFNAFLNGKPELIKTIITF